uniref:thioredoxin-disulfide reductase n=1 Tax=Coprococcus catus TaxID=116085 RepID=UPI001FA84883|nr:thioredoxin-disulfide reductase [Coprococcus catus]
MRHLYDVIIIGGGPGGYTAALYAARAGLDTLVLEKLSAGGQMALTTQIDNYPGFDETVDGFTLGEKMQKAAERFGAKTVIAEVDGVHLQGSEKAIHTNEGIFSAKTVILAMGANPKKLGLPDEKRWTGKGLHYCAACDGMFYKGKTVVVVGGGNSAAADALLLSRICKKVIVVHRREQLRATKVYHQPLMQAKNVEFQWNQTVKAVVSQDESGKMTGVRLEDVQTGEEKEVACDAVFVSVGRAPATQMLETQVVLDENGYIIADESTKTNLPGVFAVGDIRTKALRQIVTAAADGANAAYAVEEYLANK